MHAADRLRGAWRGGGREWFHVCFESAAGALLVNLLVQTHRGRPEGVLTVVCLGAVPWAEQVRVPVTFAEPGGWVLELQGACIRFESSGIRLDVSWAEIGITASIEPGTWATAPSSTHFNPGTLHWSVIPDGRVHGTVRIGDRGWPLGPRAYLDHNWGDARWGPALGWEWAYAHFPGFAIVWMRMLRRDTREVMNQGLLLWGASGICESWVDAQLETTYGPALSGYPQITTPALMRNVLPDRLSGVPATVAIRASAPSACVEFEADHAGRIIVPDDVGQGASVILEVACDATLSRADGERLRGRGVMEVVRGV